MSSCWDIHHLRNFNAKLWRKFHVTEGSTNERTNKRTNEHTNIRTDERKDENYIPLGINAGGIISEPIIQTINIIAYYIYATQHTLKMLLLSIQTCITYIYCIFGWILHGVGLHVCTWKVYLHDDLYIFFSISFSYTVMKIIRWVL